MGDVVGFHGATTLDIDPDNMMAANTGQFESLIMIGRGKDGDIRSCSSTSNEPEMLWLIEKFKQYILSEYDDED